MSESGRRDEQANRENGKGKKDVAIRPNAHEETRPVPDDKAEVVRCEKINLPVETIESICVFGEVDLNTKLLCFLSQKHIPLHVFNYYGTLSGSWLPRAEHLSGDLVIRQGESYRDETGRLSIARALLEATMHNLQVNLRRHAGGSKKVTAAKDAVVDLKRQISEADSVESLMGLEGAARRQYYGCWNEWLPEVGTKFTRRYHPPDNPVNALLSFLNSLLYAAMVNELHRTALYPGISYLHAPQSRRFSLALDLVEPFKPVLVDRLLFQLWDRKELGARDFHAHSNGVLLKDDARKKVVTKWDELLRRTVSHSRLKRHVSYRQLLRMDCYKLIKHLIEEAPYRPYRRSD